MDLNELIKGTVAAITAALGGLTDAELAQLSHMEATKDEPKRRTTLLAAIDAEIAARARQAEFAAAFDNAKAVLTGEGDADAKLAVLVEMAAAFGIQVFTKSDIDKLNARIVALAEKLQIAEAKEPEAVDLGEPVKIERLDLMAGRPPADGDWAVAFTDSNDMTLQGVPSLRFGRDAFKLTDKTALLMAEIVLPDTGPRVDVQRVWLTDAEGNGLGVCQLLAPLSAGGGSKGRFGPASLLFVRD